MQNGKGDKPRITDYKRYCKNFDEIKVRKRKDLKEFKKIKNGILRKTYK